MTELEVGAIVQLPSGAYGRVARGLYTDIGLRYQVLVVIAYQGRILRAPEWHWRVILKTGPAVTAGYVAWCMGVGAHGAEGPDRRPDVG